MQLLVTNSPFSEQQIKLLNELLPTLSPNQVQWLSGYLAFKGSQHRQDVMTTSEALTTVLDQVNPVTIVKEATVLFGSQTGNAQRLANRLTEQLKKIGYSVALSAMNKFKTTQLKETKNLFVLVSTHGEGEPPDNAKSFYEFLYSKRAPKLDDTQFSVLALGDTSYEFFCKTGQDFETRLQELGATKLADRVDCDVDFEASASAWLQAVVEELQAKEATTTVSAAVSASHVGAVTQVSAYSRQNPFPAEILESINLSGRGSGRVTMHLELSLEGSNLTYAPGDAIGIIPHNDENLVNQIIEVLGFSENEKVTLADGQSISLFTVLVEQLDITTLSKPLLEKFAPYTTHEQLSKLVGGDSSAIKGYTYGRDLLDLVTDYKPWSFNANEFVRLLRKIPARLYSIASSIKAHPDEVHLTIRKVEYEANGRQHKGVCSSFVADAVQIGDKISVFVQENPNFKLPQNNDAPIILIGPGTGVAPFRAFLEEREELGAQGKSWLFFGDRHYVTDFLYQTDWQRMLQDGVLTKLEVAFSRDSEEKVYVQHRLRQHATELYSWIEQGAYIYICGDEKHMAHDVHKALIDIIVDHQAISEQEAVDYLQQLQDDGRYQRDVY